MTTSSSSSSPASRNKTESSGGKYQPPTKWGSSGQQRAYGRRLLDALRATAGGGPLAVKASADAALALTARGQSRWSRAILLRRCRSRRKLLRVTGKIGRARTRPPPAAEAEAHRVRPDRLQVLRRLVPGCRKLSEKSVLKEAADYVAALEMQVKAMRALAEAFSAARAAEAEARGGA
ncbi:transcription factor bHLH149-like [Zingiber officinale]|uniref:transcription factor bHLH149-like n=1 Tax=Zingiber officinale TaxID=94328 RepID=UPI001C4C00EC|nr:transcription factor bHLH149-like [Zingiber officinale]